MVAVIPLLLLTQSVSASPIDTRTPFEVGFEKGFRIAFREESVQECVKSAKNAAAAGIDTTPICSCAADELLASKTVIELQGKIPDEELRTITASCISKHMHEATPTKP